VTNYQRGERICHEDKENLYTHFDLAAHPANVVPSVRIWPGPADSKKIQARRIGPDAGTYCALS
jgi:hypothetical protein